MFLLLNKYRNNVYELINGVIKKSNLKNSFNPSLILRNDNNVFCAFRALPQSGSPPFDAHLLFILNEKIKMLNLTKILRRQEVSIVADPKIFFMEQRAWCTFNTGYTLDSENQLYLMNIEEKHLRPYKCLFKKRRQVEKNWAFFTFKEKLYCLYSLDPLIVLIETRRDDQLLEITFEEHPLDTKQKFLGYSIGTQLCDSLEAKYLIGHKKIIIFKKMIYLAKAFRLSFEGVDQLDSIKIEKGSKFFIHSIKELFGRRRKWNKNLFSCTYFSGLTFWGDDFYLSYGINDCEHSIARLTKERFWR